MDPVGSVIWRLVGPLSPSWRARLLWARSGSEAAGKAVLPTVVSRGDVVVDVGANAGVYTDRLARLVGPEGSVYAFEPHPVYTRDLERIAAARGNVTFVPAAVSDGIGTAHLSVPASPSGGTSMASLQRRELSADRISVPTTTLDSQLEGVPGVRFIKCDVEGHEHEVLLGATGVLRRDRPVLLVEIEQRHRDRPVAETFTLLEDLGYRGQMLTPAGSRPLAEFDVERHQLALLATDTATSVPPPEYVNDFLFTPSDQAYRPS